MKIRKILFPPTFLLAAGLPFLIFPIFVAASPNDGDGSGQCRQAFDSEQVHKMHAVPLQVFDPEQAQRKMFNILYQSLSEGNPWFFNPVRLGIQGHAKPGSYESAVGKISLNEELNALVSTAMRSNGRLRGLAAVAAKRKERELTPEQALAFQVARISAGRERGASGAEAEINDFTPEQIKKQDNLLTEAGFTHLEIKRLRERGLLGSGGLHPTRELFFHNFYIYEEKRNDDHSRFFTVAPIEEDSNRYLIGKIIAKDSPDTLLVELIDIFGSGKIERMKMKVRGSSAWPWQRSSDIEGHRRIRKEIHPDANGRSGFVQTESFTTHNIHQGNAESLRDIFDSFQSKAREAHLAMAPPETGEERVLKATGFGEGYYEGLEAIWEWTSAAQQLREQKANPRRTHIGWLGAKMPEHFEHGKKALRAAIEASSEAETADRFSENLSALMELEKQVNQTIRESKFTYEQWIKANLELSELISPYMPKEFREKTPLHAQYINSLINFFPGHIAVISARPSGVIARNMALAEGLSVFRLPHQARAEKLWTEEPMHILHSHYIFELGIFNYSTAQAHILASSEAVYSGSSFWRVYLYLLRAIVEPTERGGAAVGTRMRENAELILWLLSSMDHNPLWIQLPKDKMKEYIIDSIEKQTARYGLRLDNPQNLVRPLTREEIKTRAAEFDALHSQNGSGGETPKNSLTDLSYIQQIEEMAEDFVNLVMRE